MGISIHIKGKIKNREELPYLIEEVKDFAIAYNWPYSVFEEIFPDEPSNKIENLYGISFTPTGCESVNVCFLDDGILTNVLAWKILNEGTDPGVRDVVSVKTQFAGFIVHKILVHFLDYLGKKYFNNLQVMDETSYYENRDEKEAGTQFSRMSSLINGVDSTFQKHPMKPGESLDMYIIRLSGELEELRKNNKSSGGDNS